MTTPIGAEGIDIEDGKHMLLAQDARGFADGLLTLQREPALGARLAAAARALVEQRYESTAQ